jgi:hypothetical protein
MRNRKLFGLGNDLMLRILGFVVGEVVGPVILNGQGCDLLKHRRLEYDLWFEVDTKLWNPIINSYSICIDLRNLS